MSNYLALFLEGLLSFLSPCILPLLPVYLGYLSSATKSEDKKKNRLSTLKMTLGFVLGICLIFFAIAFLSNSLMPFFTKNKTIFQIISGFVLIFMGLVYFGIIKIN